MIIDYSCKKNFPMLNIHGCCKCIFKTFEFCNHSALCTKVFVQRPIGLVSYQEHAQVTLCTDAAGNQYSLLVVHSYCIYNTGIIWTCEQRHSLRRKNPGYRRVYTLLTPARKKNHPSSNNPQQLFCHLPV